MTLKNKYGDADKTLETLEKELEDLHQAIMNSVSQGDPLYEKIKRYREVKEQIETLKQQI